MPNEIQKLPDGRISAKLEDGTIFEGDPIEVTTKLAEAKMNTVRWGQEWKQKAEAVQPQNPTTQSQNLTVDPNEKQLQDYLLTQTAKGLGYSSADEYKADLARVKSTAEKVNTNLVITEFFNLCPDFPNTDAASEQLAKKIDELHWDFTPQAMTAAHALLVREHAQDANKGYAPLTPEQINSAWADRMQQSSRQAAPPMLQTNNPELASGGGNDPYAIPLADLRKQAIAQELGKQR